MKINVSLELDGQATGLQDCRRRDGDRSATQGPRCWLLHVDIQVAERVLGVR